jgi:3-oxoacyl-[acyl-carrier protein] reductase
MINYRSKQARAAEIAATIQAMGRRAVLAQADMTDATAVAAMMQTVATAFGQLDYLILNASGGLEKDKPADYAMNDRSPV